MLRSTRQSCSNKIVSVHTPMLLIYANSLIYAKILPVSYRNWACNIGDDNLTPRLYGGIFVPQRALPANLVAKTCSNSPFTPSDPHLKFSDNLFCRGLKYRGCRGKCTGRF